MNYRNNATREQIAKRFNWLREANRIDAKSGIEGARKFIQVYGDYRGDHLDSMQAALDTNTPYAQDLGLRLLTEILSGNVL